MEDTSSPSWGVLLLFELLIAVVLIAAGPWLNAALDAVIL